MAKRIVFDTLNGVPVVCDVCVATAGTPELDLPRARKYVAQKWGWVVTPTDKDLCGVCVRRGELKQPEYQLPATKSKPRRKK